MKINRESVTDQIYQDLRQKIIDGEFIPGAKLQSENSLASSYGVSRLSVRSALQRLNTLGLIEIRVGEGSFVKDLNFSTLINEASSMMDRDDLTSYLGELRQAIEPAAVSLALDRASDEDRKEVSLAAEKLYSVAGENDYEKYADCEFEFHFQLVRSSGNRLFTIIYQSMRDLFLRTVRKNVRNTKNKYDISLKNNAELHVLLAHHLALGNRDETILITKLLSNVTPATDLSKIPEYEELKKGWEKD